MKRSSDEIKAVFTAKGCTVSVQYLGHSYWDGGEIFIYAPGMDPASEAGFKFTAADLQGRGRSHTGGVRLPAKARAE